MLTAEVRATVQAVVDGTVAGAVVEGDNLDVLRALPDGCVDLAYADPPFATGGTRRLTTIRTGDGDRTRRGFGGREYRYEVVSELGYADDLPLAEHLAALRERLVEVHRVLAPHGSLYLHVDWRTSHHVRLLLDEVFGPERFLNEIVWAYDYGGRPRDRWPRKHDTILWYARGDRWLFDRDAIDRVPYMAPGLVGPEKAARGKLPTDVWWMTIVPPGSTERTGTRPRSRSGSSSGSSRRPRGPGTSCSTRTPAAGRPASPRARSGDAGCSWTATRRPSRSPGRASRRARTGRSMP